jgi:hypothetical protein
MRREAKTTSTIALDWGSTLAEYSGVSTTAIYIEGPKPNTEKQKRALGAFNPFWSYIMMRKVEKSENSNSPFPLLNKLNFSYCLQGT